MRRLVTASRARPRTRRSERTSIGSARRRIVTGTRSATRPPRVKQQLQDANETGRQAVGEYVRALTRGYQAFIPQAVIDPRQAIDFAADFVVHTTELQRSMLHELVGAGQLNARAAHRAAADLSDER